MFASFTINIFDCHARARIAVFFTAVHRASLTKIRSGKREQMSLLSLDKDAFLRNFVFRKKIILARKNKWFMVYRMT